jgi:hypothetical protein
MRLIFAVMTLAFALTAQAQTYVRFSKGAAVDLFGTATAPISLRDLPASYSDPATCPGFSAPNTGCRYYESYTNSIDMSSFNSIQLTIRTFELVGSTYTPVRSSDCGQVLSVQTRSSGKPIAVLGATANYYVRQGTITSASVTAQENGQIFVPISSVAAPTVGMVNIDNAYATFRLIFNAYNNGTKKCYVHVAMLPNTVRDANIIGTSSYGETVLMDNQQGFAGSWLLFTSGYNQSTGVDGIHTLFLQNNGINPIRCAFGSPSLLGTVPAVYGARGAGPHFVLKGGTANFDGTGGTAQFNGVYGEVWCRVFDPSGNPLTPALGYLTYAGY